MAAQAQPVDCPPNLCLLRRANRAAYLQWSTILAKLQGGGQGAERRRGSQEHHCGHPLGLEDDPEGVTPCASGLGSAVD